MRSIVLIPHAVSPVKEASIAGIVEKFTQDNDQRLKDSRSFAYAKGRERVPMKKRGLLQTLREWVPWRVRIGRR